jgi:hypothetical protein
VSFPRQALLLCLNEVVNRAREHHARIRRQNLGETTCVTRFRDSNVCLAMVPGDKMPDRFGRRLSRSGRQFDHDVDCLLRVLDIAEPHDRTGRFDSGRSVRAHVLMVSDRSFRNAKEFLKSA